MGIDRRNFVKIASLSSIGLVCKPAVDLLADVQIPEEKALKAKHWAMVIDLRKCLHEKGCKDCITACHDVHNVPDFGNPKDEIKWIWKTEFHSAFHEQEQKYLDEHRKHMPALVLCNHCENPPCVKVCPTQATWKREKDGLVMMDWHRCIGCRYCVAACPYGSRSFNWRDPRPFIKDIKPDFPTRMRGVVEKCTFCEERLARGQMPACMEACKPGVIAFGDLEDPNSELRQLLQDNFTIRRKPGLGTQPSVYYIV